MGASAFDNSSTAIVKSNVFSESGALIWDDGTPGTQCRHSTSFSPASGQVGSLAMCEDKIIKEAFPDATCSECCS
jgi:hypothetical protein